MCEHIISRKSILLMIILLKKLWVTNSLYIFAKLIYK